MANASPPVSPGSSPRKNSPVVVGCLVVIAVVVGGLILLMALGWIAEKFETPAQRAAEKAQEAAASRSYEAQQAAQLAKTLASGKLAESHLAAIAAAIAVPADLKPSPCPHSDGQSPDFAMVDAELMRRFNGRIPHDVSGTAWFRDRIFADLASEPSSQYSNAENDADAAIEADKKLTETGSVGVIHTLSLTMPRLLSGAGAFKDGSYEGGSFSGWIQLISYPDGKTLCEVPFSAASSHSVGGGIRFGPPSSEPPQKQIDGDFESNFRQAAQAAVGGGTSSS